MHDSNQKEKPWWFNFTQGIKDDFKLRRILMPVRKADLNSITNSEDKLKVSSRIFISTFLLFNSSLLALYLSFKDKHSMRSIKVPIIFGCFALLAYKL
jgi:hypothetical protein